MLYPDEENISKLMSLLNYKKFRLSDTTGNSITVEVNCDTVSIGPADNPEPCYPIKEP